MVDTAGPVASPSRGRAGSSALISGDDPYYNGRPAAISG